MATSLGYFRGFGPRFPVTLVLFRGFFRWFSLNWIFTLIAFDIKGNVVLMQTGVRFFFAGRKQITSSDHRKARGDLLYRSFAIARSQSTVRCLFGQDVR